MSRKNRDKKNKQTGQPAAQPISPPENLAKPGNFLSKIRKEKAAQLLAEGDLSIVAIAANLGVHRETIRVWRHEPEFAARVEEVKRDIAELEKRFVITRKTFRVMDLAELRASLQRIRDARAESLNVPAEEGGDSGFLVKRYRMIGGGEAAEKVEEYQFDAALFKEWRAVLDQLAEELGQKVQKTALTTPDGKDEYTGIPTLDLEEFRKLPIGERIKLLRAPVRTPPAHRDEPPPAV